LSDNRKNGIKAGAGAAIYIVVVFLLLIFFGFTTKLPLPGDEGVEVNLGSDNQGRGFRQPEKPAVVKKTTPPPKAQEKVEEEIVTQDTEDAPAVQESKKEVVEEKTTEPVEEIIEEPEADPEPVVNPAALYKGKSEESTETANQGITGDEGDQGAPGGDEDSKNYLGKGGFGDGPSANLTGRRPMYLPTPSKNFQENGTVVVQITVNKYGKVVKAVAIDKGSNTTNSTLRKLAEEAAKKSEFNAKMDAAEMQRGTITYHFIVKN